MLYRAAWDGIICLGAHEGKQPTFELMDERISNKKEISNGEALANLASRYFTSHGPATIKDYMWWSGLKVSDAKIGIDGASPGLVSEKMEGKTYHMAKSSAKPTGSDGRMHLLPAYDEYLVGYSDRSAMLGSKDTQSILRSRKIFFTHSNGIFLPVVVANGDVVGAWKRRTEKGSVSVTIRPFAKLDEEHVKGARDAAARYGDFLEAPISTSFVPWVS